MLDNIIKKILSEATSTSTGSRGSYIAPLTPGIREFEDSENQPFTIQVSKYDSPFLEYDSYDGSMETPKKQIKKLEKKAEKVTNYIKNHPYATFSDDDGNIINQTPGKGKKIVPVNEWVDLDSINLNETSTAVSAGGYNGPIAIGLKKWKKSELGPFYEFADTEFNHQKKQKTIKNNVKRYIGHWEKNKDGSYKLDNHDAHTINEDLAVWFGTKKKPKGSKQPKGPWVNICRKVDGKHPPCGRSNTDKGGYPKCRAAGVASKMSDSEKKSACQQKRTAEKKDTQTGKGQKPIMTHYKSKKTNENMKRIIKLTENDLNRIIKRILKESESQEMGGKKLKGDIITSDLKRENNKNALVRLVASQEEMKRAYDDCINNPKNSKRDCLLNQKTFGKQQWTDLVYGFEGYTKSDQSKVVKVSQNSKFPTTGGISNYVIVYNCTTGRLTYEGLKSPGGDQERRDQVWLYSFCDFNWDSKVGTERKMFGNPKI